MPDADLRDLAAAARRLALLLGDVDKDVQARARHVQWRGAGVDVFHRDVQNLNARMDTDVQRFHQVAQVLTRAADKLAQQRYALQGDQNLVEDLLRGSSDPASVLREAGWHSAALPSPYDTEWKALAKRVTAVVSHPRTGG